MGTIEESLAGVPFFADLSHRDLKPLASLCVRKRFETGDVVLEEGTVGLGLFLITEGRVEVFRTESGRRRSLAVLGPGDMVGEMALIDEKPRSASAVAIAPTSALLLSRDGFRTVVKKSPAVAWALVPGLAARLRAVEDRLMEAENDDEERDVRAADFAAPDFAAPLHEAVGVVDEPADGGREPAAAAEACGSSPVAAADERFRRAPYAIWASAWAGVDGSVRALRRSGRAFADATAPGGDGKIGQVLTQLPRGAAAAATTSIVETGKVPAEMLKVFLRHLNGGGRDEG